MNEPSSQLVIPDQPRRRQDVSVQTLDTATSESASLLQVIERAAVNPHVDLDKMDRLLAMHERIADRQRVEAERVRNEAAESAYNRAMVDCQAEMRPVATDAVNSQTRSKYATYAQLDRHLRPIYTKHGFAISFSDGVCNEPDWLLVTCEVFHRDGFKKRYEKKMPADGKGAKGGDVMTKTHAIGSASSYGQRYLMRGIFNIAVGEDDDDGNGAGGARSDANHEKNKPPGFDKWRADMEACADEGTPALQAAWNKSDAALRVFAAAGGDWWPMTKARAAKATKAEKVLR